MLTITLFYHNFYLYARILLINDVSGLPCRLFTLLLICLLSINKVLFHFIYFISSKLIICAKNCLISVPKARTHMSYKSNSYEL